MAMILMIVAVSLIVHSVFKKVAYSIESILAKIIVISVISLSTHIVIKDIFAHNVIKEIADSIVSMITSNAPNVNK